MWRKVKNIIGKSKPPTLPTLNVNGVITNDPIVTSNTLAKHFQDVSSNEQYSIEFQEEKTQSESQPVVFEDDDTKPYNNAFTYQELERALNKCKDTAPGSDGITYSMLKNLTIEIKVKLLSIYNNIWEKGNYPQQWKVTTIIALPKENKDLSNPENFRPITLSSCIGKILESMINYRLISVLEKEKRISDYQAGFRRGYSTIDHLTYLDEIINKAFTETQHTFVVFFDLQKAFDTVWKHYIMKTLKAWGLKGRLPRIIQSFLEERKFRVRVGDIYSGIYEQQNGIPQGSVFSTTLFLIAINGIADEISRTSKTMLYVDDLAIAVNGTDNIKMENILQRDINKVVLEAEKRGLRFSTQKTVCMHFCRLRRRHGEPTLMLKNCAIPVVSEHKFLGLVFDRKLTWKSHIEKLVGSCKTTLNRIKA
uniref:Reverse transcriptase domain-containing protein n=1 Tax=Photinus pyralis TaxID=7054 RepID=A0A1Y1LER8_PHOPY